MDLHILLYMSNLFKWANVFISLFIILIAYSFFQRTKPHSSRTPWIILFIAVITFFIFEFSNAVFPNLNPIPELRDFFKTLFVAFILYVFVYERYLIEHSNKIIIEKKDAIVERELAQTLKPKDMTIPSMPVVANKIPNVENTASIADKITSPEIKPVSLPIKTAANSAQNNNSKPKAIKKKKTSKK